MENKQNEGQYISAVELHNGPQENNPNVSTPKRMKSFSLAKNTPHDGKQVVNVKMRVFTSLLWIVIIVAVAYLLLGRNRENNEQLQPYNVNWELVCNEWIEMLKGGENYPFVLDLHADVNHEKMSIGLYAVVWSGLDNTVVLDFADSMIRLFNTEASFQDKRITSASRDNYGSLFDEYDLLIGIAPRGEHNNIENWYVNHIIKRGRHTRSAPRIQ
ncbi:MAG: hypothetical protein FWG87_04250 [Defluviitaleaceae bacterium]|nr:hypothetical protein [Defluviitaleaceae bacterium]